MGMKYLRPQNLHKALVDHIFEFLREKNGRFGLFSNSNERNQKIVLKTGEVIYPDMVDLNKKVVYEIHVKGERRANYFDKLPVGWKGINVFYDEEDNPETLVVKFITNEVQIIRWQGAERYAKYKTAIKPHIQLLKDQIKNEGLKNLYGGKGKEITISVADLLKTIGMTEQMSMYGIQYVLFFEGIFATISVDYVEKNARHEDVFVMRERIESDILPAMLITEDEI